MAGQGQEDRYGFVVQLHLARERSGSWMAHGGILSRLQHPRASTVRGTQRMQGCCLLNE